MQNFGVTNKEYYGMLWYFLEWSIVIVFFLPYPVKFYFIYLVQSLARSHWPLWRNDVCTAAPLPSKEKWIGERDCLLLSVFVLFVCLFVFISYFEKGCQKKCTRQSRKVLWVVLSSLLSQKTWKNGRRCHGHMFVSAYGIWKATKVGSTTNQSRQEECRGGSRGRVQGVGGGGGGSWGWVRGGRPPPPPPWDGLRFSNRTGTLQKKKICGLLVLR